MKSKYIMIGIILSLCITNCWEREWNNPVDGDINQEVTTLPASGITSNSAVLGGKITIEEESIILERGVCIGISQNPTTTSNKIEMGTGTGSFSNTVTNLSLNTKYNVRAYCIADQRTIYGNQITFTTLDLELPTVTTHPADNISGSAARLNGVVSANGLNTVVSFEYGITNSYDNSALANQNPVSDKTSTIVNAEINELDGNTTYHFRVKAINNAGISYGSDLTFTTLNLLPPTATTIEADNITGISATLKAIVNANGQNTTVSFEYGPTPDYGSTISANQNPVTGVTDKIVSADIIGLSEKTSYYFRVKAINETGTSLGDQVNFTTTSDLRPTVLTLDPNDITNSTAVFGGNVTEENGSQVTERGIYISIVQNDSAPNNYRPNGSGLGIFESKFYLGSFVYYIRAYATNSHGTSFGSEISFQCPVDAIPGVSTKFPSEITQNSAVLGGTIYNHWQTTYDVTERGVCYSESSDPTIANTKIIMGSGKGQFEDTVNNLSANTRYYVRAYGINVFGTSYGDQRVFITSE